MPSRNTKKSGFHNAADDAEATSSKRLRLSEFCVGGGSGSRHDYDSTSIDYPEGKKFAPYSKTLVKSMVKACMQEKVALTSAAGSHVIDLLVGEYRVQYPSLSMPMVTDGIYAARLKQKGVEKYDEGGTVLAEDADIDDIDNGGDNQHKLSRCRQIIENEMAAYEERICVANCEECDRSVGLLKWGKSR